MSDAEGGGTMTAIPIIETTGGNISAYIPTNVISITDGQIYLESELFHSGMRPAVNTGLSVSRVGRSAQYKAMRKVSGLLRIELAQYKEMAVFARFGSDLDDTTRQTLSRGEKLNAIFKQDKNKPYTPTEEIILLLANREGAFDNISVKDMAKAKASIIEYVQKACPAACGELDNTHDFDENAENEMKAAFVRWSEEFLQESN